MSLALRPFQQEDVDRIAAAGFRALVASDAGTGKTAIALGCINRAIAQLTPVVVVCPASVTLNWRREAAAWCPWAKTLVVHGETVPLPRRKFDLYVVSWASLHARVDEFLRRGIRLVVADEFHYAKAGDSLRALALGRLTERVPHLLGLTGTPLVNEERELETLRDFFGTQDVLMIRRLLEDVAPDIPPKSRATIPVALAPRVAAEYRKAEADFAAWLSDRIAEYRDDGETEEAAEVALAAEALVKIGYLRRILGAGKVIAAVDWIARAVRLGEPVVVFAEHQDVIRRLVHLLRKRRLRTVLLDGSTSVRDRQAAVDAFQAGKVAVFVGSKAAKEGITLTRARHLLFVERWFTSAEEEQAEGRIYRISQVHPAKIWFLHAEGTVDDRLAEIIEHKRHLVRTAIGAKDIAESDEDTVRAIIRAWTRGAGAPVTPGTALLGHGATPLPALPSPAETCTILFAQPRWKTPGQARQWARLNGYHAVRVEPARDGWRVVNHEPFLFVRGTFRAIRLANDIKVIVGVRA